MSTEGTIWVASTDVLADLRRDYGLLQSSNRTVTVRISDSYVGDLANGQRDAFRLVVVADLVAEGDTRSRASAQALLQQVMKDRAWRAH